MKKRILIKFVMIGILHSFLYLWLVPFVIYPRFGHNGLLLIVLLSVLISVSILATLFIGKKAKIEQEPYIVMNSMVNQEKYDGRG